MPDDARVKQHYDREAQNKTICRRDFRRHRVLQRAAERWSYADEYSNDFLRYLHLTAMPCCLTA